MLSVLPLESVVVPVVRIPIPAIPGLTEPEIVVVPAAVPSPLSVAPKSTVSVELEARRLPAPSNTKVAPVFTATAAFAILPVRSSAPPETVTAPEFVTEPESVRLPLLFNEPWPPIEPFEEPPATVNVLPEATETVPPLRAVTKVSPLTLSVVPLIMESMVEPAPTLTVPPVIAVPVNAPTTVTLP